MAHDQITKGVGIIPDFFHDILAYIIPGYMLLLNLTINYNLVANNSPMFISDIEIWALTFLLIPAYVLGRFCEHVGKMFFDSKYLGKYSSKPKWDLIFKGDYYTESFKNNLKVKIKAWLKNQDGEQLMKECEESDNQKDEYFNLIQFYLRERFPSIALYEKKQNATIVLVRSLSIIFGANTMLYALQVGYFLCESSDSITVDYLGILWILSNLVLGYVFYKRYRLDRKYHAMYIFESFLATKRLLISKADDEKQTN